MKIIYIVLILINCLKLNSGELLFKFEVDDGKIQMIIENNSATDVYIFNEWDIEFSSTGDFFVLPETQRWYNTISIKPKDSLARTFCEGIEILKGYLPKAINYPKFILLKNKKKIRVNIFSEEEFYENVDSEIFLNIYYFDSESLIECFSEMSVDKNFFEISEKLDINLGTATNIFFETKMLSEHLIFQDTSKDKLLNEKQTKIFFKYLNKKINKKYYISNQ